LEKDNGERSFFRLKTQRRKTTMKRWIRIGLTCLLITGGCTRIDALRLDEVRHTRIHVSGVHAAFPSATRLDSGEILVVFREGSGPASPDGNILLRRSSNGGLRWSKPDTVVSASRDCRHPSIVRLRDGLIIVSFFQYRYDTDGEVIGSVGCFTVRSFDNGRTFTAPRKVVVPDMEWAATSDAILERRDGTLLLPVYGGVAGEPASVAVVLSHDGGETWPETFTIVRAMGGDGAHFEEPALMELPDGGILCMMKTTGADGFLYQSVSGDGGRTWSLPLPSGIQGEAPDLHFTSQGTLLCAYRDSWPRGISYAKSYDGGRSWEQETPLYGSDDDFGRPCLVTLPDHLLAVHYGAAESSKDLAPHCDILGTFFRVDAPETPKGFFASIGKEGEVNLRWNGVEGAAYYVVYRGITEDFIPELPGQALEGNVIATSTKPFHTDRYVTAGQTYFYRVTAVAGRGRPIPGRGCESTPTETLGVTEE
jgi:hypothetical protein